MRDSLRVAMILPGLGRVQRGAEAAFLELARQWVERPGVTLTLFGSGEQGLPEAAERHVLSCRSRETFEKWPKFPLLASEYYYEEFSFVWSLAKSRRYKPKNFDVVVSCSYPWLNWYLQRVNGRKGPLSFYVTQNGDWPCYERKNEGKYFKCDGLVCTNPVYYERNRQRYACALIPNGVDPERFTPRPAGEPVEELAEVGQVGEGRVVLIASAMIESKDVAGGVRAVSQVPGTFLVVAGDGPERERVAALAQELLPGRHRILGSVARDRMPALFRRADAFLHMSREEPSALVYLEAASTGLPMVVHDWDVTRWTLDDAAVFVDTADVAATAAGLRRVLEPDTARRLGGAARQRVLEGWSWQVLADRYLSFFQERLADCRDKDT